MVSIISACYNAFSNASNSKTCTHVGCTRTAVLPRNDTMLQLRSHLLYTFPWIHITMTKRWLPCELEYTLSCKEHMQEWVEHLIAGEVLWLVCNGWEIDRSIMSICPSSDFRDLVSLVSSSAEARETVARKENAKKRDGRLKYEKMSPVQCRDPSSCVVCYTEENIVMFKCSHKVCFDCMVKLGKMSEKKTCPYCRAIWKPSQCRRVCEQFEIIEA